MLPGGETGRSVIGRTDIDGVGIAGLELEYDGGARAAHAGRAGHRSRPEGRSIPGSEQVTQQPVPGDDIILTLDRSIQFAVEQALLGRVSRARRQGGTAVVMDTHSGDVLAMASVDRDDDGGARSRPATWRRSTPTSRARCQGDHDRRRPQPGHRHARLHVRRPVA